MTEYITKEQALEAIKGKMWPGEIEAAIKAIPPTDVVEVVRCKDCADFRPWGGGPIETWRLHGLCLRRRESVHYGRN